MISNIQALRCFAAMMVVWHHVQGPLNATLGTGMDTGFGAAGVDLFFVISGFIMFHTNAGFQRTTGQFWLDRIIRLAPLYWIATWLTIGLGWVGFTAITGGSFDAGDIVTSMLFIPHLRDNGNIAPVLELGWTLNFEMFFYLLFGLTFFLRSQKASLILLTGAFLVFCALSPFAPTTFAARALGQPLALEFAAGGGLALFYGRLRPTASPVLIGYGLIVIGALGFVVIDALLHTSLYGQDFLRTASFGIPAVAVVAGALLLEKAGHAWRSGTLLLMGSASYAIYLFHLPAILLVAKVSSLLKLHGAPVAVVSVIAAMLAAAIVGVVIHLVVEKPMQAFLKTRTRTWFRPTPRGAVAIAAE